MLEKEKLLYMIKNNSRKEIQGHDLCTSILKVADILDEMGVLLIFMTANQVNRNTPYYFNSQLKNCLQKENQE